MIEIGKENLLKAFRHTKQGWYLRNEAGQEVFLYYFRREPNARNKDFLGAFHAAEIPYVFKNLTKVPNSEIYDEIDYGLSDLMSSYWLDFAKGDFDKYKDKWQPYLIGEEAYMDFGDTTDLGEKLHEARLDVLENLLSN